MSGRRGADAKRYAEKRWRRWYSTARWRRRREAQLAAEPTCRMCRARNRVTLATVADHVVPHRGDAKLFWEGELQSICAPHHDSVKAAEEHRGYVIGSGLDGRPIDPNHPWNRRPA